MIPLAGTDSDEDNTNIRAAIAAIKASGQPGEIRMSGDFQIGHAGDMTGIDPDTCADLKLTGRGYCIQPARAVGGEGAVLMSRFDVTALVDYR